MVLLLFLMALFGFVVGGDILFFYYIVYIYIIYTVLLLKLSGEVNLPKGVVLHYNLLLLPQFCLF